MKIVHIRDTVFCKECDRPISYQYEGDEYEKVNICHTCVDTDTFIEAMRN